MEMSIISSGEKLNQSLLSQDKPKKAEPEKNEVPVFDDLRPILLNLEKQEEHLNAHAEHFLRDLRTLKRTKQGSRAFELLHKAPFSIPVFFNNNGKNYVEENRLCIDLNSESLMIVQVEGLRVFEEKYLSFVTVFHELLHLIIFMNETERLSEDETYLKKSLISTFPEMTEYADYEEYQVINGSAQSSLSENGLRRELGLPIRVSHNGIPSRMIPKKIFQMLRCYSQFNLTGNMKRLLEKEKPPLDLIIQSKALQVALKSKSAESFAMLSGYILKKAPKEGQEKLLPLFKMRKGLTLDNKNIPAALRKCVMNNTHNHLLDFFKENTVFNNDIFNSKAIILGVKYRRYRTLDNLVAYILRNDSKGKLFLAAYLEYYKLEEVIKQDPKFTEIFREVLLVDKSSPIEL